MVVEYGEILPEVTEVYVLSAADIESVKRSYHFLEKKPTYVDPNLNHVIMFTNQVSYCDSFIFARRICNLTSSRAGDQ